ncbi:hypothetical protein J2T60_002377 [Natronospira proteinivora]|uniref:Outer membrane beta-barrel porin/alpha-amylase n=1 Tax=Natronospira proteinivora TaxID=1807133 RepID=A0ABT1GEK0_9GAMM|nr:hypothetical protein [Natronospira proteinivora]MCP1728377.1 hypothetical protein [Natronospira proteinivora]
MTIKLSILSAVFAAFLLVSGGTGASQFPTEPDGSLADPMNAANEWQSVELAMQSRQPGQERRQPPAQRSPQSQRGGLNFDFNHVTAWVGTEELEETGVEADSWRLEGAIQAGDSSYLFLNWQEGDYEHRGERTAREFGMGLQEHYSDRAAFYLTVSYLQDRWDTAELDREDLNMLRGRYGIRARPTDRIEVDGAVVYTRGSGSTDIESQWSMDVGLSIYVTDAIAIRAAAMDLDGIQPSSMLGLRFEFGGF